VRDGRWKLKAECVSQLSVTVTNICNKQFIKRKELLWLTVLEAPVHNLADGFLGQKSLKAVDNGESAQCSKAASLIARKRKRARVLQFPHIYIPQ
jgi:hypothetical protein